MARSKHSLDQNTRWHLCSIIKQTKSVVYSSEHIASVGVKNARICEGSSPDADTSVRCFSQVDLNRDLRAKFVASEQVLPRLSFSRVSITDPKFESPCPFSLA